MAHVLYVPAHNKVQPVAADLSKTKSTSHMMLNALFENFFTDESIKLRALDELRRTRRGNDYLYADADLTETSSDNESVIVTGLDAAGIHAAIEAFVVDEQQGEAREIRDLSGVYVIRTKTMRFPNGLSYWIDDSEQGGLRVSLYAWSVYGRRDFGVNQAYLKALAARLTQPIH